MGMDLSAHMDALCFWYLINPELGLGYSSRYPYIICTRLVQLCYLDLSSAFNSLFIGREKKPIPCW